MRRKLEEIGRRGRRRGLTAAETLDLFSGGTFTRASEGSYLIGAPTDGSSAFLAWAVANARRLEDRGDGLGTMLLMEGARTNSIGSPRDMVAGWSAGGGVLTANDSAGPDGAVLADYYSAISGSFGSYIAAAPVIGTRIACSFYGKRRAAAGPDEAHYAYQDGGAGDGTYTNSPISETYARYELLRLIANASGYYVPMEGRTSGGLTARALAYTMDLHQFEVGAAFPSSPIRTGGGTRAADVLSYAVGQYPASFLTRGFRLTFAPDFASADMPTGTAMSLATFGGALNDFVDILHTAGVIKIRAYHGGTLILTVGGITFSRGQLLTLDVNPAAGTYALSGATSGNGVTVGTPFAFTEGALAIGYTPAAGQSIFGRFGRYIEAL
jgi:hypothetical protein